MMRRPRGGGAHDRGAVAVEFALLLPVLLLILFGIIDFGRALNAQITLTQAAREGARLAALGEPQSTVISGTQSAANGLSGVNVSVTTCPANAGPTVNGTVTASDSFSFLTPVGAIAGLVSGSSTTILSAQGVMPCET